MDSRPDKPLSKDHESYNYNRYLWDSKSAFSYSEGSEPGTLIINKGPEAKNYFTIAGSFESQMMGIFYSDRKRIDKILRRHPDGAYVRQKMDKVGDSECYVIEADIKEGKYTIRIDPAHGYNIAKAEIRKIQGNMAYGRRLGAGFNISGSFEVTRFEQVDGTWIPMEARTIGESKWPGGHFSRGTTHIKRTSVNLNPDHEALGSFVLDDIPNGVTALIVGVKGKYTWQDGQVVDEKGRVVMDCRPKKPAEKK